MRAHESQEHKIVTFDELMAVHVGNREVYKAQARLRAGDCEECCGLVSRARDIYEELGNPAGQAVILELEGELWRA